MASPTLAPDPTQVELVRLAPSATSIRVVVRANASSAACPVCGVGSARVHSRYLRQVADLPWLEVAVRLELQVRRFFCDQPDCSRTIFTERLPGVVAPSARRTLRLAHPPPGTPRRIGWILAWGKRGQPSSASTGQRGGRDTGAEP
jgi:transposase